MTEKKLLVEDDFDWAMYEATCPGKRKLNKSIKLHPGDNSKVFCNAPYAQELYDLYFGSTENLREPKEGTIVSGKITQIDDDVALVDINWREDATIDLSKENSDYLKYIQLGNPIDVLIEKIAKSSSRGTSILASYSKNILFKKKEEIKSSIGEPVAYLATVKNLIHGGYFLDIDGVTCFMPGSLGGMNKLVDFESLLNQQIYVMAINYSREKDYVVVSHREYLKTLIPDLVNNLKFNQLYSGFVTGCSKHGIFVEFNGCLTGLISKSEISDDLISDFENRLIKAGDEITFYINEIIDDNKIVLSMKEPKPKISVWDDAESRYPISSSVNGKIRKIVKYGIFVELEPKIVGLLHKSNLNEDSNFEVGQEIEVKVTKIDKEAKRVDLVM